MKRLRSKLAVLALATVLALQTACGGALVTFRLALASSAPLINSLVASGVLKQSQAEPIIADFNDGAGIALNLQSNLKACAKDRGCKFQAAQKAETSFRSIINRHHFGVNARVQQIADVADGILASLVLFYGEQKGLIAGNEMSDSQIESQLKPDVAHLKRLMRP